MKFTSWNEMYSYLKDKDDLYNPDLQKYVYHCNEDGALCVCDNVKPQYALKVAEIARQEKTDWATVLPTNGLILDNPGCDSVFEKESYLEFSYDFCKEYYDNKNWIDTSSYGTDRGKELIDLLLKMLPRQPRSFDTSDDPGFWTNGDEILCPTETECEILADFLEDVLQEISTVTVKTGYYDPYEDARSGEQDDDTGFYYIDFD